MAKAPVNSAAQRVRKKVRKNVADGIRCGEPASHQKWN